MRSSRRSLLVAGVIAVLVVLMGAGTVWAATSSLSVPANVTVTAASTTIKVYNDAACASPLIAVYFGSVPQRSASAPKTVYVRNEGNVPVCITLTGASGLPAGFTLIEDPNPNRCGVLPYAVEAFTVYLAVPSDAKAGGVSSITINFTSSQS